MIPFWRKKKKKPSINISKTLAKQQLLTSVLKCNRIKTTGLTVKASFIKPIYSCTNSWLHVKSFWHSIGGANVNQKKAPEAWFLWAAHSWLPSACSQNCLVLEKTKYKQTTVNACYKPNCGRIIDFFGKTKLVQVDVCQPIHYLQKRNQKVTK